MSVHPTTYSEDEAWQDGYEAFCNGESDTDNPHDVNTGEHLSWNDGYHEAERTEGAC